MLDEILGGMDKELSAMLRAEYTKRGIKFMLDTKVVSLSGNVLEDGQAQVQVNYENAGGAGSVVAERLLMSVGRRPVTKGFGLENLGLEKTERGIYGLTADADVCSGCVCLRGLNRIFLAGPYGGT